MDKYETAISELVAAYDAFEAANEAVKEFEKGRTDWPAAWPQPTIQPGGSDAREWRAKMREKGY